MNVLHLISSGGMYGAEAVILQLSAEMNRNAGDHSSLGVFSHGSEPALHRAAADAGVASELIPCRGQLDTSVSGKIRALAARVGADVVHAHGYKADIYTYVAFRARSRPALVSTCHTWYDNDLAVRVYGAVDRWVLRHFDQVVAVSAEVQGRLWRAGVQAGRTRLIGNGVTVPPRPPGAACREVSEGLRAGLVGRLAPEKGVDLFLQAIASFRGRHPETHFVVAGEGPERPVLDALVTQLGLQAKVTLLGRQDDMQAFYRSLDLLVSASRQEGLPMALLEGMAAGLPVVATSVGEVAKVVVDGETGLVVSPGKPEALGDAMETLLSNPTLRKSFGEAGRQRILNLYSAQRMTAEYLDVYQRAVQTLTTPGRTASSAERAL